MRAEPSPHPGSGLAWTWRRQRRNSPLASAGYKFHVPASHFFMKLAFAAPASFLPSLPTALVSQHFFIELAFAAPARALPSLPTALAAQAAPSCARAGPTANNESVAARAIHFI